MWPFKKKLKIRETEVNYLLHPKEDITAYELALILRAKGSRKAIQELPKEALRHMTEVVVDAETYDPIHYRPALKE